MLVSTQQVALTQIPVTNVNALGPIHPEFHYGILELLKQKEMNVRYRSIELSYIYIKVNDVE